MEKRRRKKLKENGRKLLTANFTFPTSKKSQEVDHHPFLSLLLDCNAERMEKGLLLDLEMHARGVYELPLWLKRVEVQNNKNKKCKKWQKKNENKKF